jgi:hypothetical protein
VAEAAGKVKGGHQSGKGSITKYRLKPTLGRERAPGNPHFAAAFRIDGSTATPQRRKSSMNASDIQEHMTIVGSCGNPVGTVDHVQGDHIKLTRSSDPHHQGHHHFLPLSHVKGVEEGKVVLNVNSEEAKKALLAQLPG